jgi:hypothetical protein
MGGEVPGGALPYRPSTGSTMLTSVIPDFGVGGLSTVMITTSPD